MPLVGSAMAAELVSVLTGNGFAGPDLPFFCNALGNGIVASTVGKAFSTTDVGSGPSAGVGAGIGLTGYLAPAALSAMLAEATLKGFILTPEASNVYDSVSQAYSNQLALATLTSAHTPVYLGTGTVVPGSISIPKGPTSSTIASIGVGLGMLGADYADFCDVVAAGIEAGVAALTGTVIIAGPPPPTPAPATGSGTGVIS